MNHPLICTTGLKSDVGRQRRLNEDAADVFALAGAETAWVVCDGMGGLRAGDVASQEAVRVVREALQSGFQNGVPSQPLETLSRALQSANDAVNLLGTPAQEDAPTEAPADAPRGVAPPAMGTTCVAGMVVEDTLYLAHAGDSRAYHWQRGHLTRLTEDHSFVAERVKAGDMTEAEAKVSRFRNIVTRAIGIDKTVEPETQHLPLASGDQILVCSDGLTTVLDDDEIVDIMNRPVHLKGNPERLASALVDAANAKGGPDNITVLVVRAEDASPGGSTTRAASRPLPIDVPRTRSGKGGPGWGMLLLGMLLGVGLSAAAYTFSPQVRAQVGNLTQTPRPRATGSTGSTGDTRQPLDSSAPDFAHLVYDAPQPFSSFWAIEDKLSYSPGAGLYFVVGSSGKAAYLNKAGVAVATVENLPVPDKPAPPPTDFDVQMTSDPQGNVYFSYAKQRIVTKVSPESQILTTIHGFERPGAIAVDDDGNLYVVDNITIKICRAHSPTPTPAATPTPVASGTPRPKKKPKASPTP